MYYDYLGEEWCLPVNISVRDISRELNEKENSSWTWAMPFLWLGLWKEYKKENEKARGSQGSPFPPLSDLLWHVQLSSITASLPRWTELNETMSQGKSFHSQVTDVRHLVIEKQTTNATVSLLQCCLPFRVLLLSEQPHSCGHLQITSRSFSFCANCSKTN